MNKKIALSLLSVLLLLPLLGCDQSSNEQQTRDTIDNNASVVDGKKNASNAPTSDANTAQLNAKGEQKHKEQLTAARSWDDIKRTGYIRALKLNFELEEALPRSYSAAAYHQSLLENFALEHQLAIKWISARSLNDMLEKLNTFQADIIARHLTMTESRASKIQFTLPVSSSREQLIIASHAPKPNLEQTQSITLLPGSSFIETVKENFPNWQIETFDGGVSSDDIANLLSEGKVELTLLDESTVNTLLDYRQDIRVIKTLPAIKKQAWAIHPNAPALLQQLNNFINAHHLSSPTEAKRTADLDNIKKQKRPLRMITRNSPETYFLWRGELMGFDYDLLKEFAKRQGVPLQVIVADSYQQMQDLLNDGSGDVIAAGISRTEKRQKNSQFSIRYNRVNEHLIAHRDAAPITNLNDLNNRTIHVRRSSAFWMTLTSLQKKYSFNLVAADESLSTEMLIDQVDNREIDLTVADSNLLAIEQTFRDDIVSPLVLKESIPIAYVVRENNPKLLTELNAFIAKEYRQVFYNVTKQKYFSDESQKKKLREERLLLGNQLSPYDDLVKPAAQAFNFDWRLITSQMYQESKFDPTAQSFAGARGLMQVLPKTASEFGFEQLTQPQEGILAGVTYLDWTRDRFDTKLPPQERLYFALAAYNAGFGHVRDAQKLAKQLNLRDDRWFNHVEKAMLLLQQPKYYKNARFGYCRGSEPVNYVRNIHQRYLSYLNLVP